MATTSDTQSVNDSEASTPNSQEIQQRTPLPKLQLFIVYFVAFTEPIAALVIYPFVNQYVRESGITGGDERKTGYFAGLIESTFFVVEASTVFFWGRASDHFGRKPILLLGPLGLAFALLSFGLAGRSFAVMLISRAFQGTFNGNIGVAKTVVAEVTDSTNMAYAYSFGTLVWTSGATIAPIMGGILARPAEHWPSVFGRYRLFWDYPYFLPCAAAAGIALLASITTLIGLRETLSSAKRKLQQTSHLPGEEAPLLDGTHSEYGSTQPGADNTGTQQHHEAPVPFRELMIPQILKPLVVYGLMTFVDMCAVVLQPLVYSTSIELGGLGLSPFQIGTIMGVWGFLNASLQACFLGPVMHRLGPKKILIGTFSSYTIVLALYPLLRYLVMAAGEVNGPVKAVLAIQLICTFTVSAAYSAMQIIVVNSAPNKSSLGATNGMAQAVASGMRALSPTVASSLFSVSLQSSFLGGNLAFVILSMTAAVALYRATQLSVRV